MNNDWIDLYDVLILSGLSYQPSQQVFLLIDDDVFPIQPKGMEQENSRTVSQETKDITTADSTTISVVTGYTDSNRKITRFSYHLSDTIIEKLKHAESGRVSILCRTRNSNAESKIVQIENAKTIDSERVNLFSVLLVR
jgi:hypothetical protein